MALSPQLTPLDHIVSGGVSTVAGMTDSANTLPTQVHAFGTANGYFDPEREDLYGAFPLNNPEIKDMADELSLIHI